MPYCSKCGAKLDEEANFCPMCGTPAGLPRAKPEARRKEMPPISIIAIVLIAIVLAGVIFTAIAFLSVHTVGPVERRMSVPRKPGVDMLNLNLTADVARINIIFENLTRESQSPSIILNASATGTVGAFSPSDFLEHYMPVWQNETTGHVLTVTITQKADTSVWSWFSSLNITFDIHIDFSMNTSFNIHTGTGGVFLNTQAGVVINSLNLEATTGAVEVNLVEDVAVVGDISLKTTTGGVKLYWDNIVVSNSAKVNVTTTTGGVDINVTQYARLDANVELKAAVTTGGINLSLRIQGVDIGAKIESSVTTGSVNVENSFGFSGTKTPLTSSNYPASHNFDVNLKTTTGGININAGASA